MTGIVAADSDDMLVILEEHGAARRALARQVRAERDDPAAVRRERDPKTRALRREVNCPHGQPRWKCWTCSPPSEEEVWGDFLDQYPNQRNEILRKERGYPR